MYKYGSNTYSGHVDRNAHAEGWRLGEEELPGGQARQGGEAGIEDRVGVYPTCAGTWPPMPGFYSQRRILSYFSLSSLAGGLALFSSSSFSILGAVPASRIEPTTKVIGTVD
jgi:hypothetical protein